MKDLRALSLTPPWPWAILRCGKRIENRLKWKSCAYRGTVFLHASGLPGPVATWWRRTQSDPLYTPTERQSDELDDFTGIVTDSYSNATAAGIVAGAVTMHELCSMAGHIVGAFDIIGVVRESGTVVQDSPGPSFTLNIQRPLSDVERLWWMGGFALLLDNVREFEKPIPCKGALGLWRVPADVVGQVELAYRG